MKMNQVMKRTANVCEVELCFGLLSLSFTPYIVMG